MKTNKNFLEEYTLLGELGEGGFAKVNKVRHNELGYIRAIRVLNETITNEYSKAYQNFLRECKVLLRLGNGSHPHIVHIYQPRLLENRALVEMDYVEGKNISSFLQDNKNFVSVNEVIHMIKDIASALAYCHEDIYRFCVDPDEDNIENDPFDGSKLQIDSKTEKHLIDKYKVIHNDIHSGNIMRREDGSFVLLDFGLAITGKDDVRNSSRHIQGRIEFKAPEKWENDEILTEQSDIYSFGIAIYEYLAGRVPFPLDSGIQNRTEAEFNLYKSHKEQIPPPINDVRKAYFESNNQGQEYTKDYPSWLEDIIFKCLAKDPKDRPSAKDILRFIDEHTKIDINVMVQSLKAENISLIETIKSIEAKNIELNQQLNELIKPHPEPRKRCRYLHYILGVVLAGGLCYVFDKTIYKPIKTIIPDTRVDSLNAVIARKNDTIYQQQQKIDRFIFDMLNE